MKIAFHLIFLWDKIYTLIWLSDSHTNRKQYHSPYKGSVCRLEKLKNALAEPQPLTRANNPGNNKARYQLVYHIRRKKEMDFMKNQNNSNLQDKSQEKEPNTATAVIYHVQKAARQGYIFVTVVFVTLFIGAGLLVAASSEY